MRIADLIAHFLAAKNKEERVQVLAQKILGNKDLHRLVLENLCAHDLNDLAKWAITCHEARDMTRHTNETFWNFVWNIHHPKPLGPKQSERAKAYCVKDVLASTKKVLKLRKAGLCERHLRLITQLRSEGSIHAKDFKHVKIAFEKNEDNRLVYVAELRPYSSTQLDFKRLKIIDAKRRLERDMADLEKMEPYALMSIDDAAAEVARLMTVV